MLKLTETSTKGIVVRKVWKSDEDVSHEYCSMNNEIIVYYPNMKSRKHIIETLVHEYQHYLQSPLWMKRYYTMGYTYDNHPYEVKKAYDEEKNWKLFN